MIVNDTIQVDTSPSSEAEVIKVTGFIKEHNISGHDLSSRFIKDGGEISSLGLTHGVDLCKRL